MTSVLIYVNSGARVLLLLPSSESKLMARWQEPFEVVHWVGAVDYKVWDHGKKKETQIYHIDFLKAQRDCESLFTTSFPSDPEQNPQAPLSQDSNMVPLREGLWPFQQAQMLQVI